MISIESQAIEEFYQIHGIPCTVLVNGRRRQAIDIGKRPDAKPARPELVGEPDRMLKAIGYWNNTDNAAQVPGLIRAHLEEHGTTKLRDLCVLLNASIEFVEASVAKMPDVYRFRSGGFGSPVAFTLDKTEAQNTPYDQVLRYLGNGPASIPEMRDALGLKQNQVVSAIRRGERNGTIESAGPAIYTPPGGRPAGVELKRLTEDSK